MKQTARSPVAALRLTSAKEGGGDGTSRQFSAFPRSGLSAPRVHKGAPPARPAGRGALGDRWTHPVLLYPHSTPSQTSPHSL